MRRQIRGGRILDPFSGREEKADLLIEDGRIAAVGELPLEPCESVFDASGLVIAPGLVDVHVHFRDPGLTYKEDIETGALAAAAGGFTTVVCMANTKPAADCPEILEYVLKKGAGTGIRVLSCGAVTRGLKGQELTDMEALYRAGAAGFTDDGIPILDERILRQAMEEAARLDVPLSLHEEDPALIENNGINQGDVSHQLDIGGSPALAEDIMVARDCMLALHTGATVDIQHISSRNSVAMVRLAKLLGAPVMSEVTPHHFSLDESAVLKHGSLAKMNPPLRTELDREAILHGLLDGTIDLIATDHAPHSAEEKARPLTEAAPALCPACSTARRFRRKRWRTPAPRPTDLQANSFYSSSTISVSAQENSGLTSVPWPFLLLNSSLLPWILAILSARASPSPAPCCFLLLALSTM